MGVLIGDLIITDSKVVEAGVYKAGAVLGKVTDTGKLKLSAVKGPYGNNIRDGSEKPYCILLEDVNTDTDRIVPVLLFGEVAESELTFGNGWDLETLKDELKKIGIFAKGVVNG